MKFYLGVFLILISSCSFSQKIVKQSSPPRTISSVCSDVSQIDVKLFPEFDDNTLMAYHLSVKLKNSEGFATDCNETEFRVTDQAQNPLKFIVKKLEAGSYFLTLSSDVSTSTSDLIVWIGEKTKKKFSLAKKLPDKSHTKLNLIQYDNNRLYFHLTILDKKLNPVILDGPPELIIEGDAKLIDMLSVTDGEWIITIDFPQENQILYISMRISGVYFSKIFRFQHVEK